MGKKFGFGIVGGGMAATPHVRALADLDDTVAVHGVYMRNPENRRAFAEANGYAAAASYEDLLANPEIDAILLLTPPNARTELVAAAAKAGKHVLAEKPVERSTEAATQIVETCENTGVKLGIIFQHRFRAASQTLKQLMADTALGELASAYLVVPWWRGTAYYQEPGRGTFAQDGGGVLITQAIHSLDLFGSLTGPILEVQAIAGTSSLHDIEVEDFVGAGIRFANGALGSIMATTGAFPGEQEYMVLNCTKASAKLAGSVLTVQWHDGRTETFGAEASTGGGDDRMAFPHDWHRDQIAEFVDAVQAGRDPESSGRTALQVHRLIDALLASSREGRLVRVAS